MLGLGRCCSRASGCLPRSGAKQPGAGQMFLEIGLGHYAPVTHSVGVAGLNSLRILRLLPGCRSGDTCCGGWLLGA